MGVFGVPMFVLDGELFWGGDRVDMLIERLNKRRAEQEPMACCKTMYDQIDPLQRLKI